MIRSTCYAAGLMALALVNTPAAAQTIIMGSVGSSSANSWATYVAVEKGLFTAAGIKPDIVHAQSNASVIQPSLGLCSGGDGFAPQVSQGDEDTSMV